jgi:hypothetical protein
MKGKLMEPTYKDLLVALSDMTPEKAYNRIKQLEYA